MNYLIIHKIVLYLKNPKIAKLFFYIKEYHTIVNSSKAHFEELYQIYGTRCWYCVNNLRSVQTMCKFDLTTNQCSKCLLYVSDDNRIIPMDFAAENGYLDIIIWLHEQQNKWSKCSIDAIINAAYMGHLDTVKWLHENITPQSFITTTYYQQFDFNKCICCKEVMEMAALNGQLEVIKWLHENCTVGCTLLAMDSAAKNGHLEVVKWLHENRQEGCSPYAMDWAAQNGHLEVVKWLHQNKGIQGTHWIMEYAAQYGHLEVIKWLYQNCKTTSHPQWAINSAARYGHLEIIKWFHEQKELMSNNNVEKIVEVATTYNHPEIVMWIESTIKENYNYQYYPNNLPPYSDIIYNFVQSTYSNIINAIVNME